MAARLRLCVLLGLAVAGVAAVAAVSGPSARGSTGEVTAGYPGNATAGEKIFVADCGKCHTMRAAGSAGTLGPDLDNLPDLTFAVVINAIVEGAGGIQAEYAIHSACTTGLRTRCLTWNELNDIAKFVTTEDGKPAFSQAVPQPVPT